MNQKLNQTLQYIFAVLAVLFLALAMVGRIYGYNNSSTPTNNNPEDYSSYADTGTKFSILNEAEQTNIKNGLTHESNTDVKGHGKITIKYSFNGIDVNALGTLDGNNVFTIFNETINEGYSFKDYLVLISTNIKTNDKSLIYIKDKTREKEFSSFDYNGYKFYITEIISVKDNTLKISATCIKDNLVYKADGSTEDISLFPSTEAYKAEFDINYINKILFDPTMTSVRSFLNN